MLLWRQILVGGLIFFSLEAGSVVLAQTPAEEPAEVSRTGPPPGRGPYLAAGYIHSFRTSIDGGGAFSTQTAFATGQLGVPVGKGFIVGAQVAWQGDWYSFDGPNQVSLSAQRRPWGDVQSFAVSGTVGRRVDAWWFHAVFSTRFSFEEGASLGSSFNPGGIAGFQYTFSPGLKLGLGILVNARLEDDPLIVPIPYLHWEIVEGLILSNSIAPEAYPRGPGVELAWRFRPQWSLALGGRWEYRRFRLNDDGAALRRGGVGEDEGVPLWLRLTWRATPNLRADLLGGASLVNRLRLTDASGATLRSEGTDSVPMLGAFVSYRF